MSFKISGIDKRMSFENAAELAAMLGYDLRTTKATQSMLRTEAAMSTSLNQYSFQIINNQTANQNATRVLNTFLNMQDVFFVTELFIGWTIGTATATNGKLYTYPNVVQDSGAALNALYNGTLNILNNNEVVLKNWDVQRHLIVPRTQQNTNFNVASPTSPAVFAIDQNNGATDGWYPVEPGLVLNGGGQYVTTINLPGPIATIPTNGAIVLMFRGILLQNATTVK